MTEDEDGFHEYDETCPHCRPSALDPQTGQVLSPDHPIMQVLNKVWETLSKAEKSAFMRVTTKNSKDKGDLLFMNAVVEKFTAEAKRREMN